VRRGGGHLLTEHGPDRELVGVDGARHPAAGGLGHLWGEHRVGGQQFGDRLGVGVQVQQAAAAADGDGQVPQIGQGQLAADVLGPGPQGHDRVPARQPHRAPVAAVPPFLDARHGGRREVAEQAVGDQRLAEQQPQGRRAGAGVGPAPLAGPEPGQLRLGGTGVKHHVLRLGGHHRAARPAIDPRDGHRRVEPAVKPGVLGLNRPHAPVSVFVHPSSMPAGRVLV